MCNYTNKHCLCLNTEMSMSVDCKNGPDEPSAAVSLPKLADADEGKHHTFPL